MTLTLLLTMLQIQFTLRCIWLIVDHILYYFMND